jgi:hypothetical protein
LRSREEGHDLESAMRRVQSAYPHENIERWIDDALVAAETMPVEEPAVEPEPPEEDELDVLEADARGKVEGAEAAEGRLSLDALGDPAMAEELRSVQSERASAEKVLRQVDLARGERQRRGDAAQAKREADQQAAAKREADKLTKQLHAKAPKVDAAAIAYASEVAGYADLWRQRREALIAAGIVPWGSGGDPSGALTSGLHRALVDADVWRLIDFTISVPGRPLADNDG